MNETMPLDPLVAIVTGAGRGLGRAMPLGLAAAGVRVLGTAARESGELQALEAEIRDRFGSDRFLPLTADAAHPEEAERTVATAPERLGRLDVLINNAGRGMKYVNPCFLTAPPPFWETPPELWRLIIDTHVNGPFFMARAADQVTGKQVIARQWTPYAPKDALADAGWELR
ncbi:SDR family NAD(P)-dependent oxidoreductase [Tepidiphilus margaritifer]|jgi:3-oxoacyl-[acyl-carrier protein] reductase|uniref:SDR family NAD(P)-dependent oxidoreductase n=1 Tax=Tepidiphilus margaritifer TaxID=203471 RepID=UPI0003FB751B|nr:SDR family NAD(P)-dependent oxidoreductase [Tepidiphilus margaritifer]